MFKLRELGRRPVTRTFGEGGFCPSGFIFIVSDCCPRCGIGGRAVGSSYGGSGTSVGGVKSLERRHILLFGPLFPLSYLAGISPSSPRKLLLLGALCGTWRADGAKPTNAALSSALRNGLVGGGSGGTPRFIFGTLGVRGTGVLRIEGPAARTTSGWTKLLAQLSVALLLASRRRLR